jgi:hypothetical protein
MNSTNYPPLTAYRVYYNDGTSMATSMAAGITLQQAQAYFIGNEFEINEKSIRIAVRVEKIK